jgi:uncharacterized membrane protein YfcA
MGQAGMDSSLILHNSSFILVFLIVFAAIFTQTITGFGLALVSMPLLVLVMPVQVAAPLVALVGGVAELLLLIKHRAAFNIRAVAVLVAAMVLGIPVGVYLLGQVDEGVVTAVLGVIVVAYALYALFGFKLPALAHKGWAVGFGFVAGILGGAYNTSGPPVIIYGNCRGWEPAEFKGNLQGFFLVASVAVIVAHVIGGNLTAVVWTNFFVAIPAILMGLVVGSVLEKRINPARFRQIVLVALVGLGLSLIFL